MIARFSTTGVRIVTLWASLLSLIGCGADAPKVVTTSDLTFPVVVIFGSSSAALYRDAGDLGTMQIGHLNAVTEPPPLIDSAFAIYRLAKLGSTHGGVWLMTHPTGSTPVTFELEPWPQTGIAAARELLTKRLDNQTWREDLVEARAGIAQGTELQTMFGIVKGEQ